MAYEIFGELGGGRGMVERHENANPPNCSQMCCTNLIEIESCQHYGLVTLSIRRILRSVLRLGAL